MKIRELINYLSTIDGDAEISPEFDLQKWFPQPYRIKSSFIFEVEARHSDQSHFMIRTMKSANTSRIKVSGTLRGLEFL